MLGRFPEAAALTLAVLPQFYESGQWSVDLYVKMAEISVFCSEVRSIVKTVIMAALDIIGKINEDNSTNEPRSRRKVSWSVKLIVDNDHRLFMSAPEIL